MDLQAEIQLSIPTHNDGGLIFISPNVQVTLFGLKTELLYSITTYVIQVLTRFV